MSDFVAVARLEDLPENEPAGVNIDGREIVLINVGDEVFALEDRCSHEEFPLSAGEIGGGQITCALHGARFDLATGAVKALPAVMPVKRYDTRVQDGEVQIRLDA